MHIEIKRGVDIPIADRPTKIFPSSLEERVTFALDLRPFEGTRFSLLIEEGDRVKMGQPLLERKGDPGYFFVAPAGGKVLQIIRGQKRVLQAILIEKDPIEEFVEYPPFDLSKATAEEVFQRLKEGGGLPYISERPFGLLPEGKKLPSSIFISAVASLPFSPSAEEVLKGHEKLFQRGVDLLAKIAPGHIHLVYRKGNSAFSSIKNTHLHTISGPHPIGNPSLHIQEIDPIQSREDIRWAMSVRTVLLIGSLAGEGEKKGRFFEEKIIGVGGNAIQKEQVGFYRTREGAAISSLLKNKLISPSNSDTCRIISGDPLTGREATLSDYIGLFDEAIAVIPRPKDRELLHFFRAGRQKYSASRAYLSGLLSAPKDGFSFTTNQHGEERAFVDATLYEKVNPFQIPVMELTKALMANDSEKAEELGLLGVVPEDFALPTFVCPSKIPIMDIVREGIQNYLKE